MVVGWLEVWGAWVGEAELWRSIRFRRSQNFRMVFFGICKTCERALSWSRVGSFLLTSAWCCWRGNLPKIGRFSSRWSSYSNHGIFLVGFRLCEVPGLLRVQPLSWTSLVVIDTFRAFWSFQRVSNHQNFIRADTQSLRYLRSGPQIFVLDYSRSTTSGLIFEAKISGMKFLN